MQAVLFNLGLQLKQRISVCVFRRKGKRFVKKAVGITPSAETEPEQFGDP